MEKSKHNSKYGLACWTSIALLKWFLLQTLILGFVLMETDSSPSPLTKRPDRLSHRQHHHCCQGKGSKMPPHSGRRAGAAQVEQTPLEAHLLGVLPQRLPDGADFTLTVGQRGEGTRVKRFPVAVTNRRPSDQQTLRCPSSRQPAFVTDCFVRQQYHTQMAALDASKSDWALITMVTASKSERISEKCSWGGAWVVPSTKLCVWCLQQQWQKSSPGFDDYSSTFISYLEEQPSISVAFLCSPSEIWALSLQHLSYPATRLCVKFNPSPLHLLGWNRFVSGKKRSHELHWSVIFTCTRLPLPSRWSRSLDSRSCALPAPGNSQKSLYRCFHTSHLHLWGPLTPLERRRLRDKTHRSFSLVL